MPGYDATGALGDIFSDLDDDQPDPEVTEQGRALAEVAARTESILDARPAVPAELVIGLARGLPALDDIREIGDGDDSELTETEREQKGRTENIIRSATAAGEAAVWVIAEGLECAAKGRWWRASHPTYALYVKDLTGRSASYARRLRSAAPLALETAARTGIVPNPGQGREARKVEQQYGRDAAVLLFQAVSDVAGELGTGITAETLAAARNQLPAALPEVPGQKRAQIEQAARRAIGPGVPIGTPTFEGNSNKGMPIGTPAGEASQPQEPPADTDRAGGADPEDSADDDIIDVEIVPDPLAPLHDALSALKALNQSVTKKTLTQAAQEGDPAEYAKLREALLSGATSLQKKALHAPRVHGPAPVCGACGAEAVPSPTGMKTVPAGAYWWCVACKTTQGVRKPL